MWRAKLLALASVWVFLLLGCSQGSGLHSVHGKVLWRGKPTPGARVIFHPVAEAPDAPQPSALVGEDGSFRLGTHAPGDGAPAGEYRVTIDWFDLSDSKLMTDVGDGSPKSADKLKGRYADPKRSMLRATIKQGDNELPPFELK